MKKFIQITFSAIIVILLTASVSSAQQSYRKVKLQFDPIINEANIPAKSAAYFHDQVERSFMELNRIEVIQGETPNNGVSTKPLPKGHGKVKNNAGSVSERSAKPSTPGTFKANVLAKVTLKSFEITDAPDRQQSVKGPAANHGPSGENDFVIAAKRGILKGKIEFIDVATGSIVETMMIGGRHTQNGKSAKINQATMLKSTMKKAINKLRGNVKYVFQGEFVVTKMLEGKDGQAFNVIISNGSKKDIQVGYTYKVFTKDSTGKGEIKTNEIGEIVILTVKENESMAKVEDGKSNIFKNLQNKNQMFVTLK